MSNDKVNIVCVYWDGNFRGRDYCPSDVIRLRDTVMAHADGIPFDFYCLTNDIRDIEYNQIPLKYNLPGWWSKLEIFRDDLPFTGRSIYIDLDCIIISSLRKIFEYTKNALAFMSPIGVPSDGKTYRSPSPRDENKLIVRRYQSSLISWMAGDVHINIPELISSGVMNKYRGDQDLFGDIFRNKAIMFPSIWFNKLKYCYHYGPTGDVKIVLGNPKRLFRRAINEQWPRYIKKDE